MRGQIYNFNSILQVFYIKKRLLFFNMLNTILLDCFIFLKATFLFHSTSLKPLSA
jgi:hypothetical protein